jgi:hypothetical protein
MGQEVTFRGGGRGQSSSGRNGNNRGKGNRDGKPRNNTGSNKPPEMKFVPHGIGKETVTYQTVKDCIIQLVQKSFRNGKDVADSLRPMEKINMTKNMPTRRISRETGTDKTTEQEGFDMLYKAEIDIYTKRKDEFEDNMDKVYSLIFLQHCNKMIQDRITGHPEFKNKIENDPIELLKAVEILINDPVQGTHTHPWIHDQINYKIHDLQAAGE